MMDQGEAVKDGQRGTTTGQETIPLRVVLNIKGAKGGADEKVRKG